MVVGIREAGDNRRAVQVYHSTRTTRPSRRIPSNVHVSPFLHHKGLRARLTLIHRVDVPVEENEISGARLRRRVAHKQQERRHDNSHTPILPYSHTASHRTSTFGGSAKAAQASATPAAVVSPLWIRIRYEKVIEPPAGTVWSPAWAS